MFGRLIGQAFYCFLDRYTGYNKVIITFEDKEKTTCTCSYGIFCDTYRHNPGLIVDQIVIIEISNENLWEILKEI